MDNKKFEQLIDLVINENEEKARALFHEIVVEKSREIYESMMYEEEEKEEKVEEAKEEDEEQETVEEGLEDMGEGDMDQVEGLLDEISAEEEGMTEEDEELADIEMSDDEEGMDDMGGEEDLEDRVVDLEDKLDELMAEFEELMAKEGGEEEHMGDEDMGDMGDEGMGGDEDMMEAEEEEEETLEESTQLIAVKTPTHGDNGQNTKSPTLGSNKKISNNGAKPHNFSQGGDSTKGGTQGGLLNPTTKDVKGAGSFKNAPGQKGQDLTAAPKAKHGDDGSDKKSPVAESKKVVKKPVTSTTTKKIVKK